MTVINRGKGATPSERILADLGDRAFLNLWSYPNLFIDKKKNGKGDGKELCDLLVACGDDIIIFSDKKIAYQQDKSWKVAWPRFYRKAIQDSVDQIEGAARWITQFPERVFTDAACTQRLPIDLPAQDMRRLHGVVVAGGAYQACQRFTGDDSGSFLIVPHFKGEKQHIDVEAGGFMPFCLGDPNPGRMFMHVFDNESILKVLTHLDTISDFTRYLNRRAEYLRSGKLLTAHGEEELLARYMITAITGHRGFEAPRKKKNKKALAVTAQGEWRTYLFSNEYFSKTRADEVSYLWDDIIKMFSRSVIQGTSVAVWGNNPSPNLSERGLRFMALEDRTSRRILGDAVRTAMDTAIAADGERFARTMIVNGDERDNTVGYILLILARPDKLDDNYEQYRKGRLRLLQAYCLALLYDWRATIKTAVGIAVDASSIQTGKQGGSEDIMACQVTEWTDAVIAEAEEAKKLYEIYDPGRVKKTAVSVNEFPINHLRKR